MDPRVQAILSTPFGQNLKANEAAALAEATRERRVSSGDALFVAGDESDALFLVVEGSLNVTLGKHSANPVVVSTAGPGQVLGELEIMTRTRRVASLVATDDSHLLELPVPAFEAMLADNNPAANKLLKTIAQALARRLTAANQRVIDNSRTETPTEEPTAADDTPTAGTSAQQENEADAVVLDDDDLGVLDQLWG